MHPKLEATASSLHLLHDRLPDPADVAQLRGQLCRMLQVTRRKCRRQLLQRTQPSRSEAVAQVSDCTGTTTV